MKSLFLRKMVMTGLILTGLYSGPVNAFTLVEALVTMNLVDTIESNLAGTVDISTNTEVSAQNIVKLYVLDTATGSWSEVAQSTYDVDGKYSFTATQVVLDENSTYKVVAMGGAKAGRAAILNNPSAKGTNSADMGDGTTALALSVDGLAASIAGSNQSVVNHLIQVQVDTLTSNSSIPSLMTGFFNKMTTGAAFAGAFPLLNTTERLEVLKKVQQNSEASTYFKTGVQAYVANPNGTLGAIFNADVVELINYLTFLRCLKDPANSATKCVNARKIALAITNNDYSGLTGDVLTVALLVVLEMATMTIEGSTIDNFFTASQDYFANNGSFLPDVATENANYGYVYDDNFFTFGLGIDATYGFGFLAADQSNAGGYRYTAAVNYDSSGNLVTIKCKSNAAGTTALAGTDLPAWDATSELFTCAAGFTAF